MIKMKRIYCLASLILLLLSGVSWGSETLKFELTPEMIEKSWKYESSEGWYVVSVLLNADSKERFLEITKANIGKRLEVHFNGRVVAAAVIKEGISSGVIRIGQDLSKIDASALLEAIGKTSSKKVKKKPEDAPDRNKSKISNADDFLKKVVENIGNYESTGDETFLLSALKRSNIELEENPNNCDAYYWKAIALAKLGCYQKARSVLDEGISRPCEDLARKIASFYLIKGVIAYKADMKDIAYQDYQKAVDYYHERLEANPRDSDALIGVLQTLCLMGQKKEGLELINKMLAKDPNYWVLKQGSKFITDFDSSLYLKKVFRPKRLQADKNAEGCD